jgi:hypothetical protein
VGSDAGVVIGGIAGFIAGARAAVSMQRPVMCFIRHNDVLHFDTTFRPSKRCRAAPAP